MPSLCKQAPEIDCGQNSQKRNNNNNDERKKRKRKKIEVHQNLL